MLKKTVPGSFKRPHPEPATVDILLTLELIFKSLLFITLHSVLERIWIKGSYLEWVYFSLSIYKE